MPNNSGIDGKNLSAVAYWRTKSSDIDDLQDLKDHKTPLEGKQYVSIVLEISGEDKVATKFGDINKAEDGAYALMTAFGVAAVIGAALAF